jgi:uncharacterized protein (UPF0332 family)
MRTAEKWLEEARLRVRDAELLLNEKRPSRAVSTAYFAGNAAARAALQLTDEEVKTHKGILNRLSYHFIRTGRLSSDVSSILGDLIDCRLQADYELATFSEDETRAKIDAARRCVDEIAGLLSSE